MIILKLGPSCPRFAAAIGAFLIIIEVLGSITAAKALYPKPLIKQALVLFVLLSSRFQIYRAFPTNLPLTNQP